MTIRRQLPVYSPLSAGSILAATLPGGPADPRAELAALLARRFDAHDVSLYGSGTQALTAALTAALHQVGNDRAVALPGYTCYDVATAAVGADARVLLYDIDPDTLAPDWDSLERALEAGAGVAVLAPLYGIPFDWAPALALAQRFGTVLIEDAAQAAGATWEGRPVGTFGDVTTLSFGRGKGWTGGGGGAALWRGSDGDSHGDSHAEPAHRPAAAAPVAGRSPVVLALTPGLQWMLGRPALYGIPRALPWLHLGETRYHDPRPLEPMTSFSASLVLRTRERARNEADARRSAGHRWAHDLAGAGVRFPDTAADAGYLRFPFRISRPEARRRVLRDGAPFGVEPGYPTTLAPLPALRARLGSSPRLAGLPGAETLARDTVTLPTHSRLTARDRAALLAILADAARP